MAHKIALARGTASQRKVTGRLESVNVAMPEDVLYRGRKISTGINKMPVPGPVLVRRHNLDGDAQADLRVQGGLDKAVYVALFYNLCVDGRPDGGEPSPGWASTLRLPP
jgi:hypothetical protein